MKPWSTRYGLYSCLALGYFFFFQAEDGIRDVAVTGVQTCALPIFIRTTSDPSGADPGPTNTRPSAPTPVPRAHTARMSSTDQSAGLVWRLSTMTKSFPDPVIL